MKYLLISLFIFSFSFISYSQLEINPQVGILSTSLDNAQKAVFDTKARTGWMAGADLRFGSSLYIQPGLFLTSSKILFQYSENGNNVEQEVTRTGLKLKAMLGYYIIPTSMFKVRVAVGPTYDFQINIDDINSSVFKSDQFKKGAFNLDIGAGINILFLTLDVGYSFGLSDVVDINNLNVNTKAKYKSVFVTLGILF